MLVHMATVGQAHCGHMASVHIHRDNSQIPLRYPAREPARELVRELVCDLLASC